MLSDDERKRFEAMERTIQQQGVALDNLQAANATTDKCVIRLAETMRKADENFTANVAAAIGDIQRRQSVKA